MVDSTQSEALRAELRPVRQRKWRDLRSRVLQGTDEERDLICDDCLKFYEGSCDREFSPSCQLTTDIQVRERKEVFDELTEDEQLQYWYIHDPIAWAKVELNWDPRWYQIEPLRCSAKKKVFRMGRQIGKCLSGEARIDLADGTRRRVEDLVGQIVNVRSLQGTNVVSKKAAVFENAIKECYRVTFSSGRQLTTSYDHPYRAFDRWINTEDLRVGDRIASCGVGVFGDVDLPDEHAELLAFAIGDGGLTGGSFKFTNTNPEIVHRMEELAESQGCHLTWENDITCSVVNQKGKPNPVVNMLREHGIFGHNAKTKFVPLAIQGARKQTVALFLNRLFSNDGWASVSHLGQAQIGYCSASHDLIRDVQELLFKFGIFSTISERKIPAERRSPYHMGEFHGAFDTVSRPGPYYTSWQLFITRGEDIRKFTNEIGILGKDDALTNVAENSRSPANNERSIVDTLPEEVRALVERKLDGKSARSVLGESARVGRKRGLSRRIALEWGDKLSDPSLRAHAESDIIWDRVVRIENVGELQTYDLSVQDAGCYDDANFSAEGIIVHNTEVLAILALYDMVTKPNSWVVILCPYQDQVDLIFKRLRAFIQRSETLSNSDFKVRDKMNPHEIEYAHPDGNSWVLGMTAGVRTGQQGNKFRGQTPTLLIIDEADMLDDPTLESVLASLTGAGPIARMVVSSTPTGRRGMFWKYCTNKRLDFKEFHYTSMVSPYWTPELELFYRETYSENGFAHEFLAEFGEMEVGVFQHKYIEASLQDYSLANAVPREGEMYTMGVDWNRKGIGVHIIITGFDFVMSKFRVATKKVIDANEFTQHRAIQEIVKLNAIWNPEFIYVDEGDGTTQVEALQLWGMQNPNTRLHRKVKGVDFGSKTLIRDPMTKKFVKKATKPLVVDLCVRQVERRNCILPKGEDTQNGLVGQMRDFAIKKYGREGQPIYTDDKEHTLIAWMLSVYSVVIELTDIAKVKGSSKIAFTGPLGGDQDDLIAAHKIREFRDRKKRLAPVARTFNVGQTKKNQVGSLGEFLDSHANGMTRGFRRRVGNIRRAGVGHIGRPVWSRERTSGLRIPEEYD